METPINLKMNMYLLKDLIRNDNQGYLGRYVENTEDSIFKEITKSYLNLREKIEDIIKDKYCECYFGTHKTNFSEGEFHVFTTIEITGDEFGKYTTVKEWSIELNPLVDELV